MVGPDGYFRPGVGLTEDGKVVEGAVVVSIDFFRPEPDPDMDPNLFPEYWCDYEIKYGGEVIHADKDQGMDSIGALLRSMVSAVRCVDNPYFNAIDGSKKYRDVIPYITAIPTEWFFDMRIAGTEPTWITEEQVLFHHPDGSRVPGHIAIGCPRTGYAEYKPYCNSSLTGLEDRYAARAEGDTPSHALQLAMASLATRLHAFIAGGGRVLKPDGDGEVDLEAIFGPLMREVTSTIR
jgi:hypothetical protein